MVNLQQQERSVILGDSPLFGCLVRRLRGLCCIGFAWLSGEPTRAITRWALAKVALKPTRLSSAASWRTCTRVGASKLRALAATGVGLHSMKTVVQGFLDRDLRQVRGSSPIPGFRRDALQERILKTVKYGSACTAYPRSPPIRESATSTSMRRRSGTTLRNTCVGRFTLTGLRTSVRSAQADPQRHLRCCRAVPLAGLH